MLKVTLDLFTKRGRGRHSEEGNFAFCSPIDSYTSNKVVNDTLCNPGNPKRTYWRSNLVQIQLFAKIISFSLSAAYRFQVRGKVA